MSMSVQYYVGYYFKCEKKDTIEPSNLFPEEDFWRVWDENGSEINSFHIYICNKPCPNCFLLDHESSNTGLLDANDDLGLPDIVEKAEKILNSHYNEVELRYGIIGFVN